MKAWQRDIIICGIAIVATLLATGGFLGRMTREKKVTQTDLYALVDSSSTSVLVINRPALFSKMMLSQKGFKDIFSQYIPEVFLSVIQQCPSLPKIVFSFHEQGIVMYARADRQAEAKMEGTVFRKLFSTYSPQIQKKGEIEFTYYPDAGNRYLGYYRHGNIIVASYSKRLLETTARRQLDKQHGGESHFTTLLMALDHNVPLNIIVPTDSLNLAIQVNDSTEWRIEDRWITADVYAETRTICCIGNLPYDSLGDSLYTPLSDTLCNRLQEIFPKLQIRSQADVGTETVYFTTCGKLTSNPSYE